VALCEERGLDLAEVSDEDLAAISPQLTPDIRQVMSAEASVARKSGLGGTAPERVSDQRQALKKALRDLGGKDQR
jgi:argininosuccinate lyase